MDPGRIIPFPSVPRTGRPGNRVGGILKEAKPQCPSAADNPNPTDRVIRDLLHGSGLSPRQAIKRMDTEKDHQGPWDYQYE